MKILHNSKLKSCLKYGFLIGFLLMLNSNLLQFFPDEINLESDTGDNLINFKISNNEEPILIDNAATGGGAHNWTWVKSQTWCSGSGNLRLLWKST